MKVNASALRPGHVVEIDDKLYAVMKTVSVQPGRYKAVTHLDLRRLSDGIKVDKRFGTTDQIERVYIEERAFQYLFAEGAQYTFMDTETYEQVTVPRDIIGESVQFLSEGMQVKISLYEGQPVAVELPPSVVLEVVETEPTIKGQTAASSYKPAVLSNGIRTQVPPHVTVGTRIVVSTADGGYLERAKD
jgi:elongation factor P